MNETGRFRSLGDTADRRCECRFISQIQICPYGSAHSSYDPNPVVSYEPGSGAEFMRRSGWHERDAYGNPLNEKAESLDERTNMSNVVPIIVLSAVLVFVLLLLIILFAVGVFQLGGSKVVVSSVTPLPSVSTIHPVRDRLANRTFECEFFITEQSNSAYDDPNSAEYDQAALIIGNALNTVFLQSSLRDFGPNISLQKLENQGNDLRVPFRITLLLMSSSRITADSIRNLLLSELALLELQLNNTVIDRRRVNVRNV